MRVTDYIADYIYNLGVKEVFMVSGGGMMFLSDGLASHHNLKVVCNHHEQASAMAAVSYAKYNNNLGVAYVSTGCGGTNAITGVLNGWQDNIPCLFVSGQVKRETTTRNSGLKLRQFGVQELDIIEIVDSITKYAVMVNEPDNIAYHLDKAVYLAKSGRPGPVWLDIPMDVQGAMIDESKLQRFVPATRPEGYKLEPAAEELNILKTLLDNATRPIIIVGQGVRLANANKAFLKFVEEHQIPVVASYLGVGIMPTDHKLYLGSIGGKGSRPANFALQNADLVIAMGSRLDVSALGFEYQSFAREAKIAVIDIDPIEHQKKTIHIDLFINADISIFLASFVVNHRTSDLWLQKCSAWKEKWSSVLAQDEQSYSTSEQKVDLYYLIDNISGKMKSDAVIVSDAGSAFYATTKAIHIKERQRYITSGGQAEMGYTVPACIGVSFAKGKGEVLGITGDGSFQFNIQELQTIKHHQLPIKIFVLNNDGYLSIRATQSKFFEGRFIGTDDTSGVSFPELEKIAEAYGIKYYKISDNKSVADTVDSILEDNVPVLCEVVCKRDQEIIPAVSSATNASGQIKSRPLEDMYPFLDREELKSNMIIKLLEE